MTRSAEFVNSSNGDDELFELVIGDKKVLVSPGQSYRLVEAQSGKPFTMTASPVLQISEERKMTLQNAMMDPETREKLESIPELRGLENAVRAMFGMALRPYPTPASEESFPAEEAAQQEEA